MSTRSKRSAASAGAVNHLDVATPVKMAKLNNLTASSTIAAAEGKGGKQTKTAAATGTTSPDQHYQHMTCISVFSILSFRPHFPSRPTLSLPLTPAIQVTLSLPVFGPSSPRPLSTAQPQSPLLLPRRGWRTMVTVSVISSTGRG